MRRIVSFAALGFAAAVWSGPAAADRAARIPTELSRESLDCIECHADEDRGIYQQWGSSKHYRAHVGCYECHRADASDPDAFEHEDVWISVIVTPKDCARCHEREAREFSESHHAKAGQILGSLDNWLADIAEGDWNFYGGSAAAVSGCKQCHGSVVELDAKHRPTPATWPNSGMGRINPDGSVGSCTACHQRHAFSAAQARRPENCGKCHLGPDHPQKEIYEESKHGIAYRAHQDELHLDSPKWVLGEDYSAAPTCATCHMSAVRTTEGKLIPVTHDVGERISWNNRPPKSVRPEVADRKLGLERMAKIGWEKRRARMVDVCTVCHTIDFVSNFYEQYDGVIELYNSKFAEPGLALMKRLYAGGLLTPTKFDEPIEWTWFEIWHHEGRRARHGAAMMAPDYTQWHGLYEVAKHWYTEFVPAVRELAQKAQASSDPARRAAGRKVEEALQAVLERKEHAWFIGKLPAAERERRRKAQEEFRKRYAK